MQDFQFSNKFIINKSDLSHQKIIKYLDDIKNNSVDYADIYFQYSKNEFWSLEDGVVKIDFPKNLPGNANGDLVVACRIDNKKMGLVSVSKTTNWGTSTSIAKAEVKNAKQNYLIFIVLAVCAAYLLSLGLKKVFK